ncbi:MAG: universal stress protein [Desulfobacterales bacterium]
MMRAWRTTPFAGPFWRWTGPPASLLAVEYLKAMKSVVQDEGVIHVASPKELKAPPAWISSNFIKGQLTKICDELEAEDIPCRPHLYVGEPVPEILRAAREFNAS